MKLLRMILALCLLAAAGMASASNYTLWINGRTGGGAIGNYNSWNYWGLSTAQAGVNKKSVNWDGRSSIANQSALIRNALDCFCTGNNWCYIATHSAGDLILGYTLANYGGSARLRKNAVANSSGVCGNAGGSQTGWNIKWVRAAAGSGGGSELADIGAWTTSEPLVQDVKTSTARAMYDHNQTRGIWFYMYAGAAGGLGSAILPGQDDGVEAYHSAGGVSGSSGRSLCNPDDWFCNDLRLGTETNQGGSTKWAYHSVAFRDDNEAFSHFTEGNWSGIVAVVRSDMVNFAR
ncbi:hypothetical protein SRABI118_03643 [Massilia sp. Bi118]|uniref:hypothetical protein n=1 Tax=Massilia sp. Bi118 TaxID=2822346 RepID=UPI001DB42554|nr:hypothetical protein [Massilia sp. Bi118]CAH0276434.1 hypothetical protein SRABI118_03643 [Massilia sp. Bi118]